jgi:hypothetical protein
VSIFFRPCHPLPIMGSVHGNILVHLENEYHACHDRTRTSDATCDKAPGYTTRSLNYDQLRHIKGMTDLEFDWNHVPTLFVIDIDRDGRFSLEELKSFAFWVAGKVSKHVPPDELSSEVQARCCFQMWAACKESGDTAAVFTQWLGKLLCECNPVQSRQRRIADAPSPRDEPNSLGDAVAYLDMHGVATLHQLLLQETGGMTVPALVNLLQTAACEADLLDLHDETLDDLVPLTTALAFAQHFIEAYWEMLRSLGVLE